MDQIPEIHFRSPVIQRAAQWWADCLERGDADENEQARPMLTPIQATRLQGELAMLVWGMMSDQAREGEIVQVELVTEREATGELAEGLRRAGLRPSWVPPSTEMIVTEREVHVREGIAGPSQLVYRLTEQDELLAEAVSPLMQHVMQRMDRLDGGQSASRGALQPSRLIAELDSDG